MLHPFEQRGRVPNPDEGDVSTFGTAGFLIVLPALLFVAALLNELVQLVAVGRRQRSRRQWRAISREGGVRPASAAAASAGAKAVATIATTRNNSFFIPSPTGRPPINASDISLPTVRFFDRYQAVPVSIDSSFCNPIPGWTYRRFFRATS